MTIRGTARARAFRGGSTSLVHATAGLEGGGMQPRGLLLISVRTLAIRLMTLALMLASADWPKAGSYDDGDRLTASRGGGRRIGR